jgi:hypothetical protein
MYHKKACLIAIFSLLFFSSFCQTLKYNVILLGKKIGEATIVKSDSAGYTHYMLHSHSDAHLLGMDKKNDMLTEAVFDKGGKMISSAFDDVKNKKRLSTMTAWKNNKLDIDKDGAKSSVSGQPDFASLVLYFTEPKDHQKVFSERLGRFVDIAKQKDGKYKVVFNDYTALYTYQSGHITELQMKEDGSQVVMKLVE